MYRVRRLQDGRWQVVGAEWLAVVGSSRRDVLAATRHAIAVMLDVDDPDRFDVAG